MSTNSTRVIELNLYPQYFDLVATGRKTREVRVKYPKFDGLAVGDLIRFAVKGTDRSCMTRVTRVAARRPPDALQHIRSRRTSTRTARSAST